MRVGVEGRFYFIQEIARPLFGLALLRETSLELSEITAKDIIVLTFGMN